MGVKMKEISEGENERIRRHYIFDHQHILYVQNAYDDDGSAISLMVLNECNSDDDYVVLTFLHYS